ncbi:hypothetical protein [Fontibacter flavus]|uniref:Mobilization protein n=3 Tax=Pseudomonadati TaxID=3379134 RepID=A0ABV6FRU2_9BACT
MAQASIHFEPVKPGSEVHNYRLKSFDYVRKDLSHLNESWASSTIPEIRADVNTRYLKSVGQKMQKKATPIREAVVNINENHTLKDLQKLSKALEDRFGIRTFQIHIHKDEGHQKSKKEWKRNLHAHLVCDWTDKVTGKSLKLNQKDMIEMQDLTAQIMGMERGVSSDKKRLSSIQFKIEKEWEKLEQVLVNINNLEVQARQLSSQKKINEEELKEIQNDLSRFKAIRRDFDKLSDKYIVKNFLGLIDASKTAENIKVLALNNRDLEKEVKSWKEAFGRERKQKSEGINQYDALMKRFKESRNAFKDTFIVLQSKGKLSFSAYGEKAMKEIFQKEFGESIEKTLEDIQKKNSVKKGKDKGLGI